MRSDTLYRAVRYATHIANYTLSHSGAFPSYEILGEMPDANRSVTARGLKPLIELGIVDRVSRGRWKISDRFSIYLTALGKNEVEFNDVWEFVTAEVAPEPPAPEVNSDTGDEYDDQAEFLASEKRHFMDEDGPTDLPKVDSTGPQNKERTADQIAWDMAESKNGSMTVSMKTEWAKRFQEAVTEGVTTVSGYDADVLGFIKGSFRQAMNDALRSEWIREATEVLELAKAELTPLSRKAVDDLLKRLPVEVKR